MIRQRGARRKRGRCQLRKIGDCRIDIGVDIVLG